MSEVSQELLDIPEIRALDGRSGLIRIPQEIDIPLTDRIGALIDTSVLRRLANISQLGLVSLVYPAAHHSRFEHSLGVYRLSLLFIKQLAADLRFEELVTPRDAEILIVASLLHDVGHWPFCHPIEDMQLEIVPSHEEFAAKFIQTSEVAEILARDWHLEPSDVAEFLEGKAGTPGLKMLQSVLSGPIDVDKMDYLMRDSLHAGVPYGRNFDQPRLIGSLCCNQSADALAITEKGRTAAEMMVFARYVMFSEVYWHHAVRAATAMLQRVFYFLQADLEFESLFVQTEQDFIKTLTEKAAGTPVEPIVAAIFGKKRRLFKRLCQFSFLDEPEIYNQLARHPYSWLQRCSEEFSRRLAEEVGKNIWPEQVLFDAPPQKLEVEFNVDVYYQKQNCFRTLGEVSPVVRTLAETQFDRYVKQVRIFVVPEIAGLVDITSQQLHQILQESIRVADRPT